MDTANPTNYSALRQAGLLLGTIKNATAKHEARIAARAVPPPQKTAKRAMAARVVVPLGHGDKNKALNRSTSAYPRRQNWQPPTPTRTRLTDGWMILDHDNGNYSSRCTYKHWTYEPRVTSYAWLTYAGQTIGYHHWSTITHIAAPRGYRWAVDKNGLCLQSLADTRNDYHPDSNELRLGGKHVAFLLRQNAATRKNAAKLAKLDAAKTKKQQAEDRAAMRRAEQEGAVICMADSIRAGNCKSGTASFATRHGLDTAKHYRPTQLLKIANGDAHRVRLAVAVGLRRHRHEMAQGFCLIADHQA